MSVMPDMVVPPPWEFTATFAVTGPDAVSIGRKAITYARSLGGAAYKVTSYDVSAVHLVGERDPGSDEPSGLMWSVQVTAVLTLNVPPEPEPTEEPEPEPEEPPTEPTP